MGNELRLTITDRGDALILIDQIISDFNSTTKRQADHGRGGTIGWAGRSVFNALAKTPGVFVLPVPFDKEEVSIDTGYTDGTVAAYRQRAARSAADLGDPFDDDEVERALALLEKTDLTNLSHPAF